MNPTKADDLSLIIPCRFDSRERRQNLTVVLTVLSRLYEGLEVIVIEDAPEPEAAELVDLPGVRYVPQRNAARFHRTRLLNQGFFQLSNRPYVASFDTDVIPHPKALSQSLDLLHAGAGVVLPFDGRFCDLKGRGRRNLIEASDPTEQALEQLNAAKMGLYRGGLSLMNANSVGGTVMFDRSVLREFGGYNEVFRTWGYEDDEITARAAAFGYPYQRATDWPMLHLWHPRLTANWWWYLWPNRNRGKREEINRLSRDEIICLRDQGVYGSIEA